MSTGNSVAKNAMWLIGATTLNKVVAFFSFILVARWAGPDVTGTYAFGVSVTSLFVTLADLGMTPVIIRAIASGREEGRRFLAAALRLKLVLAPIAILLALGYGIWKGVDSVTMATIAVACLVMTADTFHLLLYGVLRGQQKLQPEAIGMFVGQIMTAFVAITVAVMGLGPVGLAAALLLGSLWNVLWAMAKVREAKVAILAPAFDDARRLLREAVPFALAGIAVKVYSYIDSLMLHAFHGEKAVGIYAVAYKMTYALQFLPLTFSAALYPALAAAWAKKAHEELKSVFVNSLRLMAVIGFPMAAGLSALAHKIIPIAYGEKYLASIPTLQILPWVLLPIFMDFPVGALLNATHRAHLKTSAMIGTMLINVILNAFLVPSMGPLGAAWAGVFSFWALYLFGMIFTVKDSGGVLVQAGILLRAGISAAVSWAAWHYGSMTMPLLPAVIFGGAISVLCAFLFRLISVKEVLLFARTRKFSTTEEDIHAES